MPVQRVHVRDHDRRKPYQNEEIHVDDYNRHQDINPRPPPGSAELGPMTYGDPTPMGAVAIHESETDLVNRIREIEERAAVQGAMTEDDLYRHERLNDQLIAMRNRRNHPDQIEVTKDIDEEVEEIEAIERELHGEEAELEETIDKIMEVAENHYGAPEHEAQEKSKERLIDSMVFHPDGQVWVNYNDTDIQTDYFDSYTLRQKHAIDWIKKDGDKTISGSTTNSTYGEAVRANRFFDRVEKETGRKVNRSGIHVVLEHYKSPEDAAKDWDIARTKLAKINLTPRLYHEDSWAGPGQWMIGSDNISWRGWRDCTWALGPEALPDKGEADIKDLANKHGVSKTEAERYLKDKALGKYN